MCEDCENCCDEEGCECEIPGTVPYMFQMLTLVTSAEEESEMFEAYDEMELEWGDGTNAKDYIPSRDNGRVTFPYYIGVDSDGDLFYREVTDFRWDQ